MASVLTFAVIGLFCWFVVPPLVKGKGKKQARRRFYWRIGGAVLVLLSVIAVINYLF